MKKLIIGSMLVLGMCNVSYAGKMSAAVKFAKGFKAIKSVMGKSIIPKRLKMQASKQGYK
ncbi:MAG: hypothetical protein HON90_03840, partial [Halobacteriovoraceae bacterium]|nr:hypothetical protein [Halobacteriovoraceae bacterium]